LGIKHSPWSFATPRTFVLILLLLISLAITVPVVSQQTSDLQQFFEENVRLSNGQIATIAGGTAVTKELPRRDAKEVFLLGAVYVQAAPEKYVAFARDFDRLRSLPSYLGLGVISDPVQLSDFEGFSFGADDIKSLSACKPGDCPVQLPGKGIEDFQQGVNWSAPDVGSQVNHLLQQNAFDGLLAYQRKGNSVLGVYNDKSEPTEVARQFSYMLSYYQVLPEHLPDFYQYLIEYPAAKPAGVEDTFYWSHVEFGLKPTLRVVHVVTMPWTTPDGVAYVIAEKQLYSSHYFETALDLTFCFPGPDQGKPGFYLVRVMGSEQAGLTGVRGRIVRRAAVSRSLSNLQKVLTTIRSTLESER
jgi:hypothetical protein